MIFQFFRRTRDDPSIAPLYGTIVAQARAEALYQRFGVPDTVNGRLEMVLLHVVLLLRRLNEEPDGAPWGQAVFDLFCQDMDDNLREMGVGDLAVPKEMQRIGEAFYYISQRAERPVAFMMQETVDQRVIAVYFDKNRRVERLANYGIKDGKIFDFVSRKTPTSGRETNYVSGFFNLFSFKPM